MTFAPFILCAFHAGHTFDTPPLHRILWRPKIYFDNDLARLTDI